MFLALPPTPALKALVQVYWFVEDLPGAYEGRPIRASPAPVAVLTIHMGRPNAAESGELVPRTSLLGPQPRARGWRSWSETCFVMVMLTLPGLARLFPHTGPDTAGRLLDLGTMIGDGRARSLADSLGPDQDPRRIAACLDRWLIARITATPPPPDMARLLAAHTVLRTGGRPGAAAATAEVNRRRLHRLFHRHLGVSPGEVADLERLGSSLRAAQTGHGDPLVGFSDQAHQIRNWRRRLGLTPGAYARAPRSPLAAHFGAQNAPAGPAYYL